MNPTLIAEVASQGALRASLNLGNPVLARSHTAAEKPAGVSIDLARELARELGVAVEFVQFDTAAKSVDALSRGLADVGFMAIDPLRATSVHFTPSYVEIEGSYLVRQDSPIQRNDEVDHADCRVVVGAGSAYDLYLTRTLKQAQIVRVPTSEEVVDAMLERRIDVAAGVRPQLEADATRVDGTRLLDGRFMVIAQAMAMPKGRSAEAEAFLDGFVTRMKTAGFVAQALARHGISGAVVAA